jgi:biopolymer transport protein ExbD
VKQPVEPVYERLTYLRRRYPIQNRRIRGFPDAAPLVDVVLILFLFFITQSSFVLQPGIRLELPPSEFADGVRFGSLVVTLSQEGMVFLNDQRTTFDGLSSAFQQAVHEAPEADLLIEADRRVRYDALMRIYSMANEAGIQRVYLANRLAAPGEAVR